MPDDTNDNWWEAEGSDWWNTLGRTPRPEPVPVPPNEPAPDPTIRSFSLFSTWGDTGTIGVDFQPSENASLSSLFESAKKFGKADELILMLRYYSQTQDVTEYVQKTEDLLYESKTSTQINNPDALTPINQLYFHMLRAYARAKEEDFERARLLWNDIADSWLDQADEYRQPFILSNLFTTSLCCSDWDKAMDYMDRLWSLIKFMDANKRHALGMWDEWVCCLILHWVFLKHCPPYSDYFCQNFKGQMLFNLQKKTVILNYLDSAFISSIVDESYYNRAREFHSELPEVEYKEKPRANL